jgi:ubiquinone biosynthesis protein UbiJ
MADMLRTRKEPTLPVPVEPADQLVGEVERNLNAFISGVNGKEPASRVPRVMTKPEGLGQEIAKAMVESAEAALTEAQNHLEQTKMRAEKICEDVRSWAEGHDALVKRFQELGKSTLESYRAYNNEQLPGEEGS